MINVFRFYENSVEFVFLVGISCLVSFGIKIWPIKYLMWTPEFFICFQIKSVNISVNTAWYWKFYVYNIHFCFRWVRNPETKKNSQWVSIIWNIFLDNILNSSSGIEKSYIYYGMISLWKIYWSTSFRIVVSESSQQFQTQWKEFKIINLEIILAIFSKIDDE